MNDAVPRRYAYSLRSGLITTDNDALADVFYNINLIEANLTKDFDDAAGTFFFLLTDAAAGLERFAEETGAETGSVRAAFDRVSDAVKNAGTSADLDKAYAQLLKMTPLLQQMADKADGEI